jgi:hypothetical protein
VVRARRSLCACLRGLPHPLGGHRPHLRQKHVIPTRMTIAPKYVTVSCWSLGCIHGARIS